MQYYLVYVQFEQNDHEYVYLSDDASIQAGDEVIVPVGIGNTEKCARVLRAGYVTEKTAPYPIKWTKKVIRKVGSAGEAADEIPAEKGPEPGSKSTIIEEAFRRKITEWTDPETGNCTAPPEELDTYRQLVMEGVEKNWPEALEALAYGSYGGNNVFPEDWKKSEECLLRLIEQSEAPNPAYYNTLGYIYYYGRTTGRVPQYEKAFQYFSVGAIHGMFESTYKMADMLIAGQGVPKNIPAAVRLIRSIYNDNREYLEEEHFECKFADVALRLGGLYEHGTGVEQDPENAYSLYLQARFAIRKRMETGDYYGDHKVAANIEEALRRCRALLPEEFFTNSISGESPSLIGALLRDSEGLDMNAVEKDGVWYLIAKRADGNEDGKVRKYLFTIPDMDLCMLSDTIIMRIDEAREVIKYAQTNSVYINHIEWSEPDRSWLFLYQDYPMIEVKCRSFSFEL